MSELIPIAHGMCADIFLSRNEGVCYRQFSPETWSPVEAFAEIQTHTALVNARINTLPLYELDRENQRIRMTDLSDGGANLVMTTPDRLQVLRHTGSEAEKLWLNTTQTRPFYNTEEFFHQLQTIIMRAGKHRILLMDNSFAFVLTPKGEAQTFIVDYDDGVFIRPILYSQDFHTQQLTYVKSYLMDIVKEFFPNLESKINQFIDQLQSENNDDENFI